MNKSDNVEAVISRINGVYSSWNRSTTIETMRQDWDALYQSSDIHADTEDRNIAGVPCRWVRPGDISNPAIAMYIHGGGFRLGSNTSHLKLMSDIARAAGCKLVGVEYRLMPEAIFPSQLDDSYAVYQSLVAEYGADRIIVMGDSAGGGLAAALLQHIKQTDNSAMPAGCVLLSAWLDMTLSGDSYETRSKSDPVHQTKMLQLLAKEYTGGAGSLDNPLLSPLFGDLSNLPPTLIQVGDCEIGLDDSVNYAKALEAAGSEVQISVWPEMIHVFQMFSDELVSAEKAIGEIGEFVKAVVKEG